MHQEKSKGKQPSIKSPPKRVAPVKSTLDEEDDNKAILAKLAPLVHAKGHGGQLTKQAANRAFQRKVLKSYFCWKELWTAAHLLKVKGHQ